MKILHVPDLHLYDQDIGYSIGYADESIKILEKVKEEFITGEYDLITLGGDIQHAKIQKTKYISAFQRILAEIGVICKERLTEKGLIDKIELYDIKGRKMPKGERFLLSVRGNHDTNPIEEFTFFDLLIDNEIIINPRYMIIDDLQINFINHTRDTSEFFEERRAKVVIGIYHNLIMDRGVYTDGFLGKSLEPSELGIFKDVDLAIINDIHAPLPVYDVITGTQKTIVITPGSLGRTSFSKGQIRDYGNLVKVEIDENYDLNVGLVEIDLTPSDIFFNKEGLLKKKMIENAFENFSLEIADLEISYFNIYDELEKVVEDEEIKDICIEILKGVE